jgi:hypothetical protein
MVLADVACETHWLDDRSLFFPFFLSLPRSCPKGPLCKVDPVGADENVRGQRLRRLGERRDGRAEDDGRGVKAPAVKVLRQLLEEEREEARLQCGNGEEGVREARRCGAVGRRSWRSRAWKVAAKAPWPARRRPRFAPVPPGAPDLPRRQGGLGIWRQPRRQGGLGIWRHGGFSAAPAAGVGSSSVSIATTVSCASLTPAAVSSSFSAPLDFAVHYSAEGTVEAETKPRRHAFDACPASYCEYTPCKDVKRSLQFPLHALLIACLGSHGGHTRGCARRSMPSPLAPSLPGHHPPIPSLPSLRV